MKLFHSLRTRISFVTGFFLVAAVLLSTGICCVIFSQLLTDKVTDIAYAELDEVGKRIQGTMDFTEQTGRTLSRMVRVELAENQPSRARLQRWTNNMAAMPFVADCTIELDEALHPSLGTIRSQVGADDLPVTGDTVGVATYECPIYNDQHQLVGKCLFRLSLNFLGEEVGTPTFSPNSFHMMTNKEHQILATTDTVNPQVKDLYQFVDAQGCDNVDMVVDFIEGRNKGVLQAYINQKEGYLCFSKVPRTNWKLFVFIPMTDLYSGTFMLKAIFMIIGVLVLIIIAVVFTRALIKRSLTPLDGMNDAAKAVARGDFNHPLPSKVTDSTELATLSATFDQMRKDIVKYIEAEKNTVVDRERIENELRIAQNIQFEMLPPVDIEHPFPRHHDFHALMRTAREVGGDLYHYHYVDHKLLFSIGDVSGKGVPSAIYMSQIITQLRYISITDIKEHTRNMELINRSVCEENTYHMFATLMLVELDLHTGDLTTCNAGHDSPIIISPDGHVSQLVTNTNIPIGLMKDYTFVKQTDRLEPGTVVFCYTDGVTEAMNAKGELYGIDRLCQVLKGSNRLTPREIVSLVQQDIDTFVGDAERSDDITMFVVQYKGA